MGRTALTLQLNDSTRFDADGNTLGRLPVPVPRAYTLRTDRFTAMCHRLSHVTTGGRSVSAPLPDAAMPGTEHLHGPAQWPHGVHVSAEPNQSRADQTLSSPSSDPLQTLRPSLTTTPTTSSHDVSYFGFPILASYASAPQ
ncbi:hypothetical protein G7Z17_g13139 [Cylindrodendrum hubeiense]|uniref:Uncharacterized protein n=1 Tax=Cylindrodendrum hubeiense TaxID=595255 RepID=A0A9P5H1K9_9HYPO|nr:hypothetical protein G7Z17_g13139 [Cylindrodendrum hubeiense]